jgi:hypothetical protein
MGRDDSGSLKPKPKRSLDQSCHSRLVIIRCDIFSLAVSEWRSSQLGRWQARA